LVDLSSDLLAEMRERVWLYTGSVFAVEGTTPMYAGTTTFVASGGSDYLLTAAHVWRALRGERFALSLEADRLLLPLLKNITEPTIVSGTEFGEWGPDLALIRLPKLVARDIGQVKTFYNIDKRRPSLDSAAPYAAGAWAVLGAPAEQSTFGPKEAVLKVSLLASVVAAARMRDGFDFVDLSYFHEGRPDLPQSYGGISGSGLWHLPISRDGDGTIVWNREAHLEGVAFFQKAANAVEGVIRCHGRTSLYEQLLPIPATDR
jgi:hypothetical protein